MKLIQWAYPRSCRLSLVPEGSSDPPDTPPMSYADETLGASSFGMRIKLEARPRR